MSLRKWAWSVHLILKRAAGVVRVKGVMLNGELQESTGLLDEQINLKCRPQGGDKCSAPRLFISVCMLVYTHTHTHIYQED